MSIKRNLPKQSPPIPQGLDPQMRRFLEGVQEQLDVGSGFQRGDKKHRWLRAIDLEQAGLAKFNMALNGGEGGLEPPQQGGSVIVRGELKNVSVSGGYDWIHVGWDPGHHWPSVEIWRAGGSDNINDAVLIGTVGNFGSQYADHDVDYGVTYRYWVRPVDENGLPQPFQPQNGMVGAIVLHPPALLAQLEDRITSTQLASSLNDYIEGIEVKADYARNQYTIKVGQGGAIGGFGLGFTSPTYNPNNPNHSMALFNVDTFAITHPSATDVDQRLVFAVEDGNVVMDAAYITNLVVTDAVIQSVNVSKIIGDTASFVSANIEEASIGSAQLSYQIYSDTWADSGGLEGWMIDRGGNAFMRGNIEATSLKAGSAMVDTLHVNGNAITSMKYVSFSSVTVSELSSRYTAFSSAFNTVSGMSGITLSLTATALGNGSGSSDGANVKIEIYNDSGVLVGVTDGAVREGWTASFSTIGFDANPKTPSVAYRVKVSNFNNGTGNGHRGFHLSNIKMTITGAFR